MTTIKRILLDRHLNPVSGNNFNHEFEFDSIDEAFKTFREFENECNNRIDIHCNTCFITPFNAHKGWYIKFIIES